MSALPRADCRAWTTYSGSGKWVCFTGQPRTMLEYKGQGSKVPLYLGFRPADGLFVELEGWTPAYRIDSVGCSLTRCTPPCRSERAVVISIAPLQGRLILSIAVSTVTGRFMLKPDPTTRNYILYLLVPGFASSRGWRGRELGSMVNIIQLIIIQGCSNFCFIVIFTALLNCWLILTSCCKTRWKMLVFDRSSIFPLILVFLSCSPLYSLPHIH